MIPIHAYAFSSSFRLKELAVLFSEGQILLKKDILVVHFSEQEQKQSMCLAFDFGALVFVNVPLEKRDRLIQTVEAKFEPDPHKLFPEDFLIEVREGAAIEAQFDRVVVPELTLPILEIVSLLLAQSASMDYYDVDIQEISKKTNKIINHLQKSGRLPGKVPDLVRFIGTCIATKNDIIATLALFDKPESTWEVPELDRLYNALRIELEIQDRFRALEAKLRTIQENLVLLVDLSKHRTTWRLELTVVILILIEVLITLWQLLQGKSHP